MAVIRLRLTVLLISELFLLLTHAAVDSGKDQFEWEILTSKNFSTQIRLHPNVLLLVTVPWCGESRSLMREISHKVAREQYKYGSLKLMVVHRNLDKVLAKSLDAVEGITVLCYHHAVPYRYQGSLRGQDVLSSVRYMMSAAAKELPFKRLNNSEDFDMFLESTDMAVILLESCEWTSKLLRQHYRNETLQGGVLAELFYKEINRTLASGGQKNSKGMGNEMISCEAEYGCGKSPWVGEFSTQNETARQIDEDAHTTLGTSCSFEEYKKFESFFLTFVAMVRDFYLPPQRQRYGLVLERSLLLPLGVEVSDPWYLVVSYAGCPGCLKVLKEENHLHNVIERHDLPVMELGNKGGDIGPSLPINKPSVLLFVDRTSDSVETQRRSWEALHSFKQVALPYWKPDQEDGKKIDRPKRSSLHTQRSTNEFGSQRLLLSSSSQKIKLNDKMSIMIINEGEHVTLDREASNLEGGSLHEILTYLVGQKKQLKLSSLAKEAGFHLLSDDIDIKLADASSSQTESQNQDLSKNSIEASDKDLLHMNKDETDEITSVEREGEESKPLSAEAPSADTEQKTPGDLRTEVSALSDHQSFKVLALSDPHQSLITDEIVSPILASKVQNSLLSDKSETLKSQSAGFNGSFLFSDCNYQLLKSLTKNSKVPRIVIIDPISQQHYILPEMANLSSNSISTFIDEFLNGTLNPYQRSGPLRNSIEMPHPPFVNLDFHEKDPIPSVTTEMFSELVFGLGKPDNQNVTNPWHKDVVVLFSSSCCGFCQRMELVVREVYRALKGYMDIVNSDSNSTEGFSREELKNNVPGVPTIYSIDCTLNECGGILRSMGQGEVYPTLLLFPAESKTPIPYNGNMMVADVIKFIANHGSNSHYLSREKGTLWVDVEEGDNHGYQLEGEFMSRGSKDHPHGKDGHLGAIDKNGESTNEGNEHATPQKIAVGSFLGATEHLHGLNLFSEAKILIVGADHDVGFQGLIVNKPISWVSIKFEDVRLAELLKVAPLSFGGPVMQEGLPFVSLTRNSLNDQHPEVLPGVYFLDPLATVHEIEKIKAGNQSATNCWFFWGYSGWGWDQLFSEIAGGAWSVHEGKPEDLQWL